MAEDRELFRDLLDRLGQPYAPSAIVEGATDEARAASVDAALAAIGLPAIVRPAFTLGGTGGGIVETEDAYRERVRAGLRASPIGQVMVEHCLVGWQEIEYEVMRDADDTCIAVCSMENVDPLGVHTGDSIVVAPVQTLPDAGPPAAAQRRARDHPGPRRRGRLQRPVRALARLARVRRHRGQPARQPQLGPGEQGDRLPDRPRRGPDRRRAPAGRDPQRRDRDDRRRLRAGPRLRRRQAAALPVRQVPDGRPDAGQPDEGDRRGDGDRPDLRLGAQQGAARPRAGGRRAAGRGPGLGRRRSTTWLRRWAVATARTRRRRRRTPSSAGSARTARPARAPASPSGARRRSSCAASSRPSDSRLWRILALLRRGVPARRSSGRRPASRPGSWPSSGGSVALEATDPAPRGRRSPTRTTRRRPRCSPPPSASASAIARSRPWPGWGSPPSRRRARRLGLVPGLRDGGHLRGRVRRRDALLLRDLRGRRLAARGAAGRAAGGARHRLRAGPDRAGDRVRLLRGPAPPTSCARLGWRRS